MTARPLSPRRADRARRVAGRGRRVGRRVTVALVLTATVTCLSGLLAPGAPGGPRPAAAAACPTSGGVSVVVDRTAFGGPVTTGCATGAPTTAAAALAAAGHAVTRVSTQPGFLCRIDGLPAPADEACVRTPPSTAYWAFWTAQRGGSWRYSTQGIDSYRPPAGSVIGFAFGAGVRPAAPPPAAPVRATPGSGSADGPGPGPAADGSSGGTPGGPSTPRTSTGHAGLTAPQRTPGARPADPTDPAARADDGPRQTLPGGRATTAGTPSPGTPTAGQGSPAPGSVAAPGSGATGSPAPAAPAASDGTGGSGGLGVATVGGLVVIVALTIAAWWTARVRRRGSSG